MHDPVIDGIRALSVLSIIAFHVVVGVIQVFSHAKAKDYIMNMPATLQPLWHGEKGVDAFFLLSGLVIGASLFKNWPRFNLKVARIFISKKFYRIYPLFLLALIVYTAAQWTHFGKYFFSNLFFLNNIIPGERTIIPVGWFLTVEVQYFLLVPPLFLSLKNTKFPGAALAALFVFSTIISAVVLVRNPQLYLRPITDLFLAPDKAAFSTLMGKAFYESNLTRFGPFVAGVLLSYLRLFYSVKITDFFKSNSLSIFALCAACAFTVFPVTTPIYDLGSWYYQPFSKGLNFFYLAFSRQSFAIGIAIFILGCSSGGLGFRSVSKILHWRAWKPISSLSFPIYLFHFPFIAVAAVAIFGTTNIAEVENISLAQGAGIFFLATLLTTVFSVPLYIYVERPLVEFGKNRNTRQ